MQHFSLETLLQPHQQQLAAVKQQAAQMSLERKSKKHPKIYTLLQGIVS